MSKIGQLNDANQLFNPIITDLTYEQLLEYANNSISINVPNAFIVSVPQNEGGDKKDAASIWMTDKDGYLLNITKPNNM